MNRMINLVVYLLIGLSLAGRSNPAIIGRPFDWQGRTDISLVSDSNVLESLDQPRTDQSARLLVNLKPYSMKSIFTGFAFSMNALSAINLKPLMSKTSSESFGSSRAISKEGPPQPTSLRKIRIGEISLPFKYSAI